MSYCHLTSSERFTLYELRFVLKESLNTIATTMGRAKSPWLAKDLGSLDVTRSVASNTLLSG